MANDLGKKVAAGICAVGLIGVVAGCEKTTAAERKATVRSNIQLGESVTDDMSIHEVMPYSVPVCIDPSGDSKMAASFPMTVVIGRNTAGTKRLIFNGPSSFYRDAAARVTYRPVNTGSIHSGQVVQLLFGSDQNCGHDWNLPIDGILEDIQYSSAMPTSRPAASTPATSMPTTNGSSSE